jgi:hypothetical protein
LARVSGVSYSLETGCSPAVIEAAFLIAIDLAKGRFS